MGARKLKVLKILIILSFALLGANCNRKSRELTLCLSSAPRTLNPLIYREVPIIQIICNIYEPLMDDDETFNIVPVLAKYWERKDSLTWVFYLRKNVKFHNGKKLTAKDVIYSFKYPAKVPHSEYVTPLVFIDSIYALTDTSFVIVTKFPYSDLITELKGHFIIPEGSDPDSSWPCGTGPYKVKEISENFIKLEINKNYWGTKPYFKRVNITFESDPQKRVEALINLKADLIDYLPLELADTVIKVGKLLYTPESAVRELELNLNIYPLNIKEVRKAICYAINRDEIVQKFYKGFATPANQFFPPGLEEHDKNLEKIPFDTIYSKKIFATLNLTKPLIVDYSVVVKDLGDLIVHQLRKVGLNVVGNPLPSPSFWNKVKTRKSHLFIMSSVFNSKYGYGALIDYFHTPSPNASFGSSNWTNYSNPIVDSLIGIMTKTDDHIERRNLAQEIQSIIMEDVPICPIVFERQFYGAQKDIYWIPNIKRRIYIAKMKRL